MKIDQAEFQEFWAKFPRKVAKIAAMKAFVKARTQATLQELIDGVERYVLHKPDYADWCYPATFLNQGRWMDDYGSVERPRYECPHTPTCNSKVWCAAQQARDRGDVA